MENFKKSLDNLNKGSMGDLSYRALGGYKRSQENILEKGSTSNLISSSAAPESPRDPKGSGGLAPVYENAKDSSADMGSGEVAVTREEHIADMLGKYRVIPVKHQSQIKTALAYFNVRVPYFEQSLMDMLVFVFYTLLVICNVAAWAPENTLLSTNLGHVTSVNCILVVLTGLRNSLLMWFLEIPFDRAISHHRLLGYLSFVVVTLHFFLYLAQWNDTISLQFQSPRNVYGLISWIFFVALIVGSLEYFRRRFFNLFYHFHIPLFSGFLYFGYLHTPVYFAAYFYSFLVLYGLDRGVRFLTGLFPRKTLLAESLPGGAVKVRFQKSKYLQYQVGQYVFINFPEICFMEWHPFTLASGPNEPYGDVVIKGLCDFTKKVVEKATEGNGSNLYIRVDGPYGKWPFNFKRYPMIVLVGGGVGVTPCMALLREIYNLNSTDGNVFGHVKNVCLIWSCPDGKALSWFSEEFRKMEAIASPKLEKYIYLTRSTEKIEGVQSGRPDVKALFGRFKGLAKYRHHHRVAVVACGPTAMVNEAWDSSINLSISICDL